MNATTRRMHYRARNAIPLSALIVAVTALVLPVVRRMRESGIGALPQGDVRRDGASA